MPPGERAVATSVIARLTTGCAALDALLGGGIECDTVTEVYGAAGTGKTNICLSAAVRAAAAGHRVLFIDTEGVSAERVGQIAGGVVPEHEEDHDGRVADVLSNVIFFRPLSMTEQHKLVEKAVKLAGSQARVGLIVVDSATTYYRLDVQSDDTMRQNLLSQILALLTLARDRRVAVLLTNQVYTDVDTDELEPVGGYVLKHNAKTILRLDWISPSVREAVLMKHRSMSEGATARFRITGDGLSDITVNDHSSVL
ncbi:MAG: DNA repair and recombination protein RadB [Thermoplasmata archaeon]|nr:DNA repair and recombination protein RadB [Thermoplasmata archaeon]